MANTLNTVTSSGQQTSTQDPQAAAPASSGGSRISDIQPGTPDNSLTSSNGISLQNNQLSTIAIPTTRASVSVTTGAPSHHRSPQITGVSAILFVAAIALFALLARPEKTTTLTK